MTLTKVFTSESGQAVLIPKEFHIDAGELYIKKVGSSIILTPQKSRWENLEQSLEEFSDDFMAEGRAQPDIPPREEL